MFALHRIFNDTLTDEFLKNRLALFKDFRRKAPEIHRNDRTLRNRFPSLAIVVGQLRTIAVLRDLRAFHNLLQEAVFIPLTDRTGNGAVIRQRIFQHITDHAVFAVFNFVG